MSEPVRPILLALRALGIGDLLTAIPSLRALADAFPSHHRVLATQPELAALAMLTGAVDSVVPVDDLPSWVACRQPPDVAVNLHSNSPATYRLLEDTTPARLIGFRSPGVPATGDFPVVVPGEHEVVRWCRMLTEHGIPADPGRLDLELDPVPVKTPAGARNATLLHPGSSDLRRRWPADRWADVARAETHAGRVVIITGSAVEESVARTITAQVPMDHSAAWYGGTDVVQLGALVSVAARVVSVDTGVAHFATAVRTPSVVLFGTANPPSRWGPPPDRPWHRVVWHGEAAADDAMGAITVDEVLAALRALRS